LKTNLLYQYYYLWSVFLLIPLWVVIFLKKKKSRTEMIYMGLFCGTCALVFDKYCSFFDYWRPPTISNIYTFESFLCGFFVMGLTAKIYEFVTNKEYVTATYPNPFFFLAVVLGNCILYIALLLLYHLNSVVIYVCMLLSSSVIFLLIKPGLYKMCLLSGVINVGLTMCWYVVILTIYPDAIKTIWLSNHLSGIFIFSVPIEEHCFSFAAGCSGSLLYKVASEIGKKRFVKGDPATLSDDSPKWRPTGEHLWKLLKPYCLPLTLLLLIIGRMVIFGNARISIWKIINVLP